MLRSLKFAAKKLLSRKLLLSRSERVIFTYHDVSDPGAAQYSPSYSTPVDVFRRQIDFLAANFELLPLAELMAGGGRGPKPRAAISFDDGFRSVLDQAFPVLSGHRIPFTVFLNRRAIEANTLEYSEEYERKQFKQRVYLDEAEVKRLALTGVGIGSHGSSHKVLSRCSVAELDEEIFGNKRYLEALTGRKVDDLAIPYGKKRHYSSQVLDFAYAGLAGHVYSSNPIWFRELNFRARQLAVPRVSLLAESAAEIIFYLNRPFFRRINL